MTLGATVRGVREIDRQIDNYIAIMRERDRKMERGKERYILPVW